MTAIETKSSWWMGAFRPSGLASWLAGVLIAWLLLASAVAHLGNPYRFLDAIHGYQLVPRSVAEILAATLPFIHLSISICLLAGWARWAAFRAGVGLFMLYTAAQASVLVRGLHVGCGCFGPAKSSAPIDPSTIAIPVAGMLICLLGWWIERDPGKAPPQAEAPTPVSP